ncbi:MAG: STAS/SEC14 domain-containing protein [Ferruginibacter sp.]
METNVDIYNIYFDAEINAVVMKWNGYATSEQFKEGTELMLNTLIRNNTSKVLADIKDMVLIGMEDQQWLDKTFLPRATDFGFKTIAMIWPDHYFNKVAVENISYKIDRQKLSINFFDDLSEARAWLKNIDAAVNN